MLLYMYINMYVQYIMYRYIDMDVQYNMYMSEYQLGLKGRPAMGNRQSWQYWGSSKKDKT